MQYYFRFFCVILFLNFLSISSNACLWDYDTIEMEQQKFPSVLELIVGKFLRHSPELYYWRIKQRSLDLQQFPDSLSLYDDLAVAYSKVGEHKKAIAIMTEKEAVQPSRYTTYSNIGTFYIFSGKLDSALYYIDKALDINPKAHFGREIYQKYLIEYLLSKSKNGKITFPLDASFYSYPQIYFSEVNQKNFYGFLLKKHAATPKKTFDILPEDELSKAIVGVMGMMKFANYDSPVLLEILGDLLFNTGNRIAARHLASRAYLHASYQVRDKKSIETYRKRVAFLLAVQYANDKKELIDIDKLEEIFKKELTEGRNFYEQIRKDEMNWIKAGDNVDALFAKKYYQDPSISVSPTKGLKHISSMKKKYINDTLIGTKLDYRPIKIYAFDSITAVNKKLIDSLFEHKLAIEVRKDSITKEDLSKNSQFSQKGNNMDNKILLVIIVLGVLFSLLFLLIRKQQP